MRSGEGPKVMKTVKRQSWPNKSGFTAGGHFAKAPLPLARSHPALPDSAAREGKGYTAKPANRHANK